METTTETNQDHRELTATEIKITLAQIEDRLVRWLDAAKECRDEFQADEFEADEFDESEKKYRDKYDIPYGVCLFPEESAFHSDKDIFMKFAKMWVRGSMDEEIFQLFTFHFGEIVELDYNWILMESPSFYYESKWPDKGDQPNLDEMEAELKRIGTRSKKKARINFKLNIGHA